MIVSHQCLNLETNLVHLKEQLTESECLKKNLNCAILELNQEKKDALEELEKVKTKLVAKDEDIKATVDTRDGAIKEMKHLMGHIKGVRAVAVLAYQSFEALEDNNTQFSFLALKLFASELRSDTLKLIF